MSKETLTVHIGDHSFECDGGLAIPDEDFTNKTKNFTIPGENHNTFEFYLKRKGVFYFRNTFGMFSVKYSQLLDIPLKYGDKIDVKIL